jgi:L-ribulose-5-phosphate 3-epimerase
MTDDNDANANLSRRAFVASVGAAAAAGSVLASTNKQSKEPVMRVRKALKVGMIAEGSDLTEKFKIAKRAGFVGVELDSPGPYSAEEVNAAKDATGMEVPGVVDSVHWRDTLSSPDAAVRAKGVAGLETALRDCKAFGGTSVLLVPAVVNKGVSYADAYERSQAEIRKVVPLAEELGVQIAFENVWNQFLLSPLEAARYVDDFASPAIGWHLDIGNIVNYGWPEHWIAALGPRVLKLDVKEFSRKKRNDEGLWKGFNVEIGEGDCGWPEVRTALDAIGYRGWAAAEVRGGDLARLTDIASRMDRVLNV